MVPGVRVMELARTTLAVSVFRLHYLLPGQYHAADGQIGLYDLLDQQVNILKKHRNQFVKVQFLGNQHLLFLPYHFSLQKFPYETLPSRKSRIRNRIFITHD